MSYQTETVKSELREAADFEQKPPSEQVEQLLRASGSFDHYVQACAARGELLRRAEATIVSLQELLHTPPETF